MAETSVQVLEGKGVDLQLYRQSPSLLGHFMVVANRLGAIRFSTLLGSHRSFHWLTCQLLLRPETLQRFMAHLASTYRAVLSPVGRLFLSRVQVLLFHSYKNSSSPLTNRLFSCASNSMLNPREALTGDNSQPKLLLFHSAAEIREGEVASLLHTNMVLRAIF